MQNSMIKKGSKQRTAILKILQDTSTHPTADWIYKKVRMEMPNISLGTVYRNLSMLTKNGIIRKLDIGDGIDHFDACCMPHYHLYCDSCGCLVDISVPYDPLLNAKVEECDDVYVSGHELIFHGKCNVCCNKNNEKK